ncbi:14-3-3-like protein GF14 kappa [Diospyros lotus]|uniref:14-3-3-like protein GF14 kappa n=1 Tax=Diospyros lotus TaxID=55363 RepID=UPI00225871A0|nr:14-3-3-like protein GF14 kappa [Diospyros lotus]
MALATRHEYLYMAKLADQAGRYEDTITFMETLVIGFIPAGDEPTLEERNLLFSAYKNLASPLRDALQVISKDTDNKKKELHVRYRSKIESKLSELCARIMKLLCLHLMPKASTDESKVFYFKMAGDYQRYMIEFKSERERMEAAMKAKASYVAAEKIAEDRLEPVHPTRLSLMLNFAVLYHDILHEPEYACSMAREAYEMAAAHRPITRRDEGVVLSVMQLLKDNYSRWVSDI